MENSDKQEIREDTGKESMATPCDDDMHLMIYGNLKIRDVESGEILVNKRFG